MKHYLLLLASLTISSAVHAGMMGNHMDGGMMGNGMGGGMMGPQFTPGQPPAKDTDPAIRKGYALTQHYCVQCHALPNPNQHTAADWPGVVKRMQGYMYQFRKPVPTTDERQFILDYLDQSVTQHN